MRKLLITGVGVLFLASCLKREDFPIRPQIEYISYTPNLNPVSAADSIGKVKFSFTDGDGDLGLGQGDTLAEFGIGQPYYYNLFVHYYEKQNGQYVEFVPVFPFHVRFQSLTPTGKDKTLEGEMEVGVYVRPGSPFDTVRYEMYIVDRALHFSDTIVTPDIVSPF